MTSTVDEIDSRRLSDANEFHTAVVCNGSPIVIRGLCSDWPANRAAARSWQSLTEYLSAMDGRATAQAFVGPPAIKGRYYYSEGLDGFNFERRDMGLAEAISAIDEAARDRAQPSVYFGSVPADQLVPGFADLNRLPFLPASIRPLLWIGNASLVSCHYDTFDNLACVVAGRRRFTLYPPETISNLYVGPIDFTMAGPPVALAVGSAPGNPRFPKFDNVRDRALVAELEPGDALFLPKLWWHQVEATEPLNMLVNYWWDAFASGPDAPYTAMMLAMIAIAERPAQERAAWRAFFDHYVFRPEGHPLAHLPADKHGMLGPLKQNYGRIRARLMQTLRGG